jgi:arylsulfatase A-like enzyme
MKTIFLVMDSLNRRLLNCYGGQGTYTPNLDRLVKHGVVFDNHYSCSLPCMPARREYMTGRANFLEAPWGPIEPWDDCLPTELRKQKKTYSHMVTDHYHYFHSGGEAYHTLFDTWELERGQEGDLWHPLVEPPEIPPFVGKNRRAYWVNQKFYDHEDETQYPTPRCFMRAMEFLDNNHNQDNWHLHLEVFDPHEPFLCPEKYTKMYGDTWEAPYHFDWPPYEAVKQDEKAVDHIRKSYQGVLTMEDVWLGHFLDKMDQYHLWEDTVLILTTDHGYMLGEHGYWAKNYMLPYEELVHIPLIICAPQSKLNGEHVTALTSTLDLMPTILELYGADIPGDVQGKSLLHLLNKDETHHDAVLFGYFGKDVNLFDGRYTYCRQPEEGAIVYHHTAMPRGFHDFLPQEKLRSAEMGVFLACSHGIPHYRIAEKSHRHVDATPYNPIYDLVKDPHQTEAIQDEALEGRLSEKMKELLDLYEAPPCQYTRLGFDRGIK